VPVLRQILRPFLYLRRRWQHHEWFWPPAAALGFRSLGGVVVHPLSAAAGWVLALTGVLWGSTELHVSHLIVGFVVVLLTGYLIGRGARLKWKADRETVAGPPASSPSPAQVIVEPGAFKGAFGWFARGKIDIHLAPKDPESDDEGPSA
jgi:hypothetical protein